MDDQVYGVTKGQASPTTDADWDSVLTPGERGSTHSNHLLLHWHQVQILLPELFPVILWEQHKQS